MRHPDEVSLQQLHSHDVSFSCSGIKSRIKAQPEDRRSKSTPGASSQCSHSAIFCGLSGARQPDTSVQRGRHSTQVITRTEGLKPRMSHVNIEAWSPFHILVLVVVPLIALKLPAVLRYLRIW